MHRWGEVSSELQSCLGVYQQMAPQHRVVDIAKVAVFCATVHRNLNFVTGEVIFLCNCCLLTANFHYICTVRNCVSFCTIHQLFVSKLSFVLGIFRDVLKSR